MRKKILTKAIVHKDKKFILLSKNAEGGYELPGVDVEMGMNLVGEIKDEIEKEYLISLKFIRTLPDAWSKLLMMHTHDLDKLLTYMVFEVQDFDEKDEFWMEINKVKDLKLGKHDKIAIDYFLSDGYNY